MTAEVSIKQNSDEKRLKTCFLHELSDVFSMLYTMDSRSRSNPALSMRKAARHKAELHFALEKVLRFDRIMREGFIHSLKGCILF